MSSSKFKSAWQVDDADTIDGMADIVSFAWNWIIKSMKKANPFH